MLVTNHVLSGATIGSLIARPVPAFAVGVASHFALDAIPHWGDAEPGAFLPVAIRDGLTGLAAVATLGMAAHPQRRWAVLAGMAGAALPDLNKPAVLFFGRSPFPPVVERLHARIQREAPHRMRQEFIVGAGLAAVALMLARRAPGRRPAEARAPRAQGARSAHETTIDGPAAS
jgi:hypothetical protein